MSKTAAIAVVATVVALVGCGGSDAGDAQDADNRVVQCAADGERVLRVDPALLATVADRVMVGGVLTPVDQGPVEAEPRLAEQLGSKAMSALERSPRCVYNNTIYWPGEVYPVGDGCNICRCNDEGDSTCTLVDCQPR